MTKSKEITVDINKLTSQATVTVRVVGRKRFTLRTRIAVWIIALGVRVSGMAFEFAGFVPKTYGQNDNTDS